MIKIGLGGGCHWCTEGVFQSILGVKRVDQGWISSQGSDTSFSEGIVVRFDPVLISLETIIEIHLITHSSQSDHGMRSKYRSAVYTFNDQQTQNVKEILFSLQEKSSRNYITQVLNFSKFKLNDEHYLDYYYKNPKAPFCQRYVVPKLKKLYKTHESNIDSLKVGLIDKS